MTDGTEKSLLTNFVTCGGAWRPGDPRLSSLVFINLVNLIGIVAISLLAWFHWSYGYAQMVPVQAAAVVIAIGNLFLLRRSLNAERAERISLSVLLVMLILFTLQGGPQKIDLLWIATFPLLAFFFKGRRHGIGWVAALAAALIAIGVAQEFKWIATPFSHIELLAILGCLAITSALVYTYERTREEQARRLTELNRKLEQEARERRAAENALRSADARLRHMAQHDPLTQLPNRLLLQDRLRQAIYHSDRTGMPVAVFFVDLDDFKPVNDELGHEGGDVLLAQVGARLANRTRRGDTVARYGGDEFVIVAAHLADEEGAFNIAEKIQGFLDEPFHVAGHDYHISASVGVAIYPRDGRNYESLIAHADAAMYTAKEGGKGRWSHKAKKMEGRGCLP